MSLARLVVTAVVVEQRSKAEVARTYGISRTWVHELVRRYQTAPDPQTCQETPILSTGFPWSAESVATAFSVWTSGAMLSI